MERVIETEHLTRRFGGRAAVDGLTLEVAVGEIFGLLGPNGAGKTTTIRMLVTLLPPSGGSARVCGFDVVGEARRVRSRIGYVMQEVSPMGFYHLTGREKAEIEASLYHIPRRRLRERVMEVLDLVGLAGDADRLVEQYSGGMQKRLDLACGLLNRPDLLVLDEPTLGLDVQSRHHIWEYIRGEGKTTVLLATNYLDEADRLCDRLLIIDHGREVVSGSPEELKRGVGGDVVQVGTPDPVRLRAALEPLATKIVDSGDGLHLYVEDAATAMPEMMRRTDGADLSRVTYTRPTLDDVFLLHTGRELRDGEGQA